MLKFPGVALFGSCVCVGIGPPRSCRTATIRPSISCSAIFGPLGQSYCDKRRADLQTTITGLLSEQYDNPVRVVAVHTAENVSQDIAREIMRRVGLAGGELSEALEDFVGEYLGPERRLTLRLA